MNGDKGLRFLGGKPLVGHVISNLAPHVCEVLLIVGTENQRKNYSEALGGNVKIFVDSYDEGSPLIGAITGLNHSKGEYAIITGCDMPFISPDAVNLLFREGEGFDGAVFHWPNGWIEPLLAVYRVESALKIALDLYKIRDLRIRMILKKLPHVKLINMAALKSVDPELLTLYDADTEDALKRAKEILKNW